MRDIDDLEEGCARFYISIYNLTKAQIDLRDKCRFQ